MDQGALNLIWLVLFLPLLGSLIQALLGGWVVRTAGEVKGKRILGALAVFPVATSFALGAYLTYLLIGLPNTERSLPPVSLFDWITLASIRIPFEVLIDPLSMTMVLVITGIGALIHLYATGYMADDRDYPRFFTYLNLFIAFMLVLVLGNNFALMFIGWEGVGLCSYLLIGFWYKDIANAKAANKAFIVNRIGDWGMTLGLLILMAVVAGNFMGQEQLGNRWLSFDVILPRVGEVIAFDSNLAAIIAVLLFIGACGKSAQFPLYFWLPDAMAGPTPVSALIHAATMVTAGVFMLNRLHAVFLLSPTGMAIVALIGAFTALFAALIAFGQTDIKKVLAYSTVSQLGFMFVACGVGAFWAGMFHVVTHAFFKALLFLGSGAVIYAMAHEQDMRRYGNLIKYIKITAGTMIVGWLAIAGIPPLAGFWSKESILGGALGNSVASLGGTLYGPFTGWVLLGVAALTAAYMTRLTWLTFFGGEERWRTALASASPHGDLHEPEHAAHSAEELGHEGSDEAHDDPHGFFFTDDELAARHEEHGHPHALEPSHEPKEPPPSMTIPLIVLAALSLIGGWALAAGDTFKNWLYPSGLPIVNPEAVSGHPHGWVGHALLYLSIAAAMAGIGYGLWVYRKGLPESEGDESKWHWFRRRAGKQFGYDEAIVDAGVEGGGAFAVALWRKFDAGIIDGFVNGLAFLAGEIGYGLRVLQTGIVRTYALWILIGAVAILVYFYNVLSSLGGAG